MTDMQQPVADDSAQQSIDFVRREEFRKFIETEVLKIIKVLAENGETPQERIQEIAKATIDSIKPEMTIEELFHNAIKLDDDHNELAPIVVQIMQEYEKKYEKKALSDVSALIKEGKYDDAQEIIKKVLLFKIM